MHKLSILFFLYCLSSFVLQTSSFARDQLFINPFQNKVLLWNGKEISNALYRWDERPFSIDEEKIILPHAIYTSSPPVFWSKNEVLFATQRGEIFLFNSSKKELRKIYSAPSRCNMESKYAGCIYSLIVRGKKKAYFTQTTFENEQLYDNLFELTPDQARPLVSKIPTPSGPIWIRPNGQLGILPYKQGVKTFTIPNEHKQFSELSPTSTPLDTGAETIIEGQTSQGENRLAIYNFEEVVIKKEANTPQEIAKAQTATFDPCSGWIWYLDPSGKVKPYVTDEKYIYANELPVNSHQCPVITHWDIIERKGSSINAGRTDVVKGFPSGTPRVPSTLIASLGHFGTMTLRSSRTILARGDTDLRIFENAFEFVNEIKRTETFIEPAQVEIWDTNRQQWISTGCDCKNPKSDVCAGMQVTNSTPGNGIVPWSRQAGGFGVNLQKLGIQETNQVRLTDCGLGLSKPYLGLDFSGFDLDAIIVNPKSLNQTPPTANVMEASEATCNLL